MTSKTLREDTERIIDKYTESKYGKRYLKNVRCEGLFLEISQLVDSAIKTAKEEERKRILGMSWKKDRICQAYHPPKPPKSDEEGLISKCCGSHVVTVNGYEGTNHWICACCQKPCDVWGTTATTTKPTECTCPNGGVDWHCPIHNEESISLCNHCNCMTKTINGVCGKCGERKRELIENEKRNMKTNEWKSDCCNAKVETFCGGDDTNYFICDKCHCMCSAHITATTGSEGYVYTEMPPITDKGKELLRKDIGMLRKWLNEESSINPRGMYTSEQLNIFFYNLLGENKHE